MPAVRESEGEKGVGHALPAGKVHHDELDGIQAIQIEFLRFPPRLGPAIAV